MKIKAVRLLTPADADEHPLAELVGGVGEDDGGVEVAALSKHPKEVGGVEIVEGGGYKATPYLQNENNYLHLSRLKCVVTELNSAKTN